MTCCFFGHRDTPYQIIDDLRDLLIHLVKEKQVNRFLVGNNGNFDRMAMSVLSELQSQFPDLQCFVVLSTYLPHKQEQYPLETLYPVELEAAPPRFAIDKRNRWMLSESNIVVGYVSYSIGGASRFFHLALKRGLETYNLFTSTSKT